MTEKGRCLIISGAPGEYSLVSDSTDYVIACDRGLRFAEEAGIQPDLLVGDFDSYEGRIPEGIPVILAPAEKDDTDTMMAVRYALEQGFAQIYLLCAIGGRLDHTLANLSAAAYVAEKNGICHLYGGREHGVMICNRSIRLPKEENCFVSVFPWSGKASGVSYEGLKYPLRDAVLSYEFALGVSNEFAAEEAEISVKDGTILILVSED